MEFDILNILQKKKKKGEFLWVPFSFFLSFFLSVRLSFFQRERRDVGGLGRPGRGGGGGGGRDPNNGGPTSSGRTSALPNQHGRVLLGMRDKHHHRRPEERAMMDVKVGVFFFFFFVCRAWNATRARERSDARTITPIPNSAPDSCKNMDTRSPMTRRRHLWVVNTCTVKNLGQSRDEHSHRESENERHAGGGARVRAARRPKAKELEHVSLLGVSQIDRSWRQWREH